MKCENCKKDTTEEYTSNKGKTICKECLEKEIYKERKRIIKKMKKENK